MTRISIRSGFGLGDTLYLQSIARYYLNKGEKVEVCSNYPIVFAPLIEQGKPLTVSQFRRIQVTHIAHYTGRKRYQDTDQFQDCCITCRIFAPVELKLDWKVRKEDLVAPLKAIGKPIILVGLPRTPMGRTDGFGDEVLPNCTVIQKAINQLKGRALLVQVGKGLPRFQFKGIDLNLANRTTVSGLLDLASVADGVLGYCSFMIPLAESFSKPGLFVWSRRGLNASHDFIRAITPQKVFHRKDLLRAVVDDCSPEDLSAAVEDLFCRMWKPREVAA